MKEQKKIIIVDDSKPIRQRLRQLIESDPSCEVIAETGSGIEAVSLILSLRPQFVTLDIKMPDISGIKVLQEIQSIIKETTVIVVSNHYFEPYITKCTELGAVHYLDKSNDYDQLNIILSKPNS